VSVILEKRYSWKCFNFQKCDRKNFRASSISCTISS